LSVLTRLKRLRLSRIRQELATQADRGRRWVSQRRRFGPGISTRAFFVVGCQRSGTNMVMWTLERSPEVWVYHEHFWSPAFRDYRLRTTSVVDRLIQRCPAPVVAFKPVCDSHLVDRYLERHQGSRAVWVYRRYEDVANSAVRNFRAHQRDMMQWIVRGDTDWLGWRGERIAPDVLELIRNTFRESMPYEEGASLFWYMRSRLYFDLGLDQDDRVLLVRYEDLVDQEGQDFQRLFGFVGLPYDPAFRRDVFQTSIGKHPFPEIDGRVRDACEALQERLDGAHRRASSPKVSHPSPSGADRSAHTMAGSPSR